MARPGRSGDYMWHVIPAVVDQHFVDAHADLVLADVRWYLDGRDGREAFEAGMAAAIPLGRFGRPEELAKAAMRLAIYKMPIKCKFVTKRDFETLDVAAAAPDAGVPETVETVE